MRNASLVCVFSLILALASCGESKQPYDNMLSSLYVGLPLDDFLQLHDGPSKTPVFTGAFYQDLEEICSGEGICTPSNLLEVLFGDEPIQDSNQNIEMRNPSISKNVRLFVGSGYRAFVLEIFHTEETRQIIGWIGMRRPN